MSIASIIPDIIAEKIVSDPLGALDLAFKFKDKVIYPLTQTQRTEVIQYINEHITSGYKFGDIKYNFQKGYIQIGEIKKSKADYDDFGGKYGKSTYTIKALCVIFAVCYMNKTDNDECVDISTDRFKGLFQIAFSYLYMGKGGKQTAGKIKANEYTHVLGAAGAIVKKNSKDWDIKQKKIKGKIYILVKKSPKS